MASWIIEKPFDLKRKNVNPEFVPAEKSKQEATDAACLKLVMLTGEDKPWPYWEKKGYRLRRVKR